MSFYTGKLETKKKTMQCRTKIWLAKQVHTFLLSEVLNLEIETRKKLQQLTVISKWSHHDLTLTSPWSHHDLTMISPCLKFDMSLYCMYWRLWTSYLWLPWSDWLIDCDQFNRLNTSQSEMLAILSRHEEFSINNLIERPRVCYFRYWLVDLVCTLKSLPGQVFGKCSP